MEDLATLLDAVQKYRVQIFFSFEPREDTTFNHVATAGIEKFVDKCEPLMHNTYSEFAIPCIPSFTVTPKEKSGVRLDIESGSNAFKITTTLAKEISGFTNEI